MLSRCYSTMFPLPFSPNDSLQIGDPVHRNIFPAICMVTYCDNSQSNCCSFAMWRCLLHHPPWLTWVLNGQMGRILPQGKYNEITKLRQWWQSKLKKSKITTLRVHHDFSLHFLAVPSNHEWNDQILSSLENGNGKIINFTGSLFELGQGPLSSAPT